MESLHEQIPRDILPCDEALDGTGPRLPNQVCPSQMFLALLVVRNSVHVQVNSLSGRHQLVSFSGKIYIIGIVFYAN